MKNITVLLITVAIMFSDMSYGQVKEESSDREYWIATAIKTFDPVIRNLSQDRLRKHIPIGRSSSAQKSSREFLTHMEAVGRTFAGLGPWLELGPDRSSEGRIRKKYIDMSCRALTNSVNPKSNDYFNSTATRQILVNSAFLIQGLLSAPTQLWANLDGLTQQRFIEQWLSTRTMIPGNNNWLLFSAMVECGLKEFGGQWNFDVVCHALDSHEKWYMGDGVYGDGPTLHLDYYNSYVIHPMLMKVLSVVSKYTDQYKNMHTKQMERFARYAQIQERMIAPDGTYPVLGRSVTYRFAAFQSLSQSALSKSLPENITPPQVRSALTAVMHQIYDRSSTYDSEGWLTIGVCGEQPELGDSYLSTPCLYLCSVGFLPLGLPAEDEFWSSPAQDWSSRKAFGGKKIPIDKFLKQ